jgi:hypothetical protein
MTGATSGSANKSPAGVVTSSRSRPKQAALDGTSEIARKRPELRKRWSQRCAGLPSRGRGRGSDPLAPTSRSFQSCSVRRSRSACATTSSSSRAAGAGSTSGHPARGRCPFAGRSAPLGAHDHDITRLEGRTHRAARVRRARPLRRLRLRERIDHRIGGRRGVRSQCLLRASVRVPVTRSVAIQAPRRGPHRVEHTQIAGLPGGSSVRRLRRGWFYRVRDRDEERREGVPEGPQPAAGSAALTRARLSVGRRSGSRASFPFDETFERPARRRFDLEPELCHSSAPQCGQGWLPADPSASCVCIEVGCHPRWLSTALHRWHPVRGGSRSLRVSRVTQPRKRASWVLSARRCTFLIAGTG